MTRILLAACVVLLLGVPAQADHIWINEIDYNTDVTEAEFIEVALRTPNGSGFGPSDYAVEIYEGTTGDLVFTSANLSDVTIIESGPFPIVNSASTISLFTGFGPLGVDGIPNANGGAALVNITNNTVVQFLSWDSSFTADADNGGIAGAAGATSELIAFTDAGIGQSVGATGTGFADEDFDAASFGGMAVTSGGVNIGQSFFADNPAGVPEPSTWALLTLAGLSFAGYNVRRRKTAKTEA